MSNKVSIDALASAVIDALQEYRDLSMDGLHEAIDKGKKTAINEIKATAPVKTGKYAKSWRAKVMQDTSSRYEVTVYSPTRYMLAHLLEHGHANRGGGRTPGREHLAPAEQHAIEIVEQTLEQKLKGG